MRSTLIAISTIVLLISCQERKSATPKQIFFTVRQIRLQPDTTISAIAYYQNNIIGWQDNGKLIVIDSNYKRQDAIEKRLNTLKTYYIATIHDTILVSTEKDVYFIDAKFNLQKYNNKERIFLRSIYEDSVYYVYSCCAGEFGGSIFFLNKKTNKTYSYFATCATQVLKFKNEYVVCKNLAHLVGHMGFFIVPEPTKLYELTDQRFKSHCNWYMEIDSLKDQKSRNSQNQVKNRPDIWGAMSMASFVYNDSLYSMISNDSSTYIAVHRKDSTYEMQRLFNKRIQFHNAQVICTGNKTICLYNLTGGSPFEAYMITGNNSGLLVIENNKIDFLN